MDSIRTRNPQAALMSLEAAAVSAGGGCTVGLLTGLRDRLIHAL